MSKIGKLPIPLPEGVEVKVEEGQVTVRGPKGVNIVPVRPEVEVRLEDRSLRVVPKGEGRAVRAFWGLTRSLVANAVEGVTKGFEKRLLIEGVGYRAELQGKDLKLSLGFSHPVVFSPPEGIEFAVENETAGPGRPAVVVVRGIDKQKVGEVAAEIRAKRPPEPYKGKGIRYSDEQVRRKAGKTAR
ncbi:MAG: 50S ribosomal protein L6 [Candidatus Latescibacterota bacterium]|nr:MAG: 50S ribosomal protein L6 [Candidatus Latescibacterota bacterium]RKY65145.1 MAG: 50S ribosomal protein L6 [Candidatus Latescibacterota bacterium]RKY66159.1 MAG: 50S ribosomal protein L6 [Candidatus Latescibacterota bacterium]RKY71013.1 MAG: 50S ribosomal protein L6 [Candidatus Latescibacterota bacterium]